MELTPDALYREKGQETVLSEYAQLLGGARELWLHFTDKLLDGAGFPEHHVVLNEDTWREMLLFEMAITRKFIQKNGYIPAQVQEDFFYRCFPGPMIQQPEPIVRIATEHYAIYLGPAEEGCRFLKTCYIRGSTIAKRPSRRSAST
ncbi:MAG TPA: hypothetical protein VGM23_11355 [Armatimonadota bacterium]|jgi:hypothetical protein